MLDLAPRYLTEIKKTLKTIVPDCEVRVFGSRVTGNAKKFSDLDLALIGKEKIDWQLIEQLKDAFAESDLPYMVDVLDWNALSKEFQRLIEKQSVTIQKGTNRNPMTT